jgi:hypothetical protein
VPSHLKAQGDAAVAWRVAVQRHEPDLSFEWQPDGGQPEPRLPGLYAAIGQVGRTSMSSASRWPAR